MYQESKFKKKRENKDDLDLFLNGPNFMRNGTIIPMLLIMVIFLQVPRQKVCLSMHEV